MELPDSLLFYFLLKIKIVSIHKYQLGNSIHTTSCFNRQTRKIIKLYSQLWRWCILEMTAVNLNEDFDKIFNNFFLIYVCTKMASLTKWKKNICQWWKMKWKYDELNHFSNFSTAFCYVVLYVTLICENKMLYAICNPIDSWNTWGVKFSMENLFTGIIFFLWIV